MADNAKHINYSLTDIEQYFAGKLSAEEMHAMERAALQDPFLADAMDGYAQANMNVAKEHLSIIEKELLKEKEETKVIAITKNKFSLLKIAASVIGVALVGIIAYLVLQPKQANNNEAIAVIKTDTAIQHKEIQVHKDSVPSTALIASKISKNKKKEVNISETKSQPQLFAKTEKEITVADKKIDSTNKLKEVTVVDYDVQKKKYFTESAAELKAKTQADNPSPELMKEVAGVNPKKFNTGHLISGKITTDSGTPIVGASVVLHDKKISTTTDLNGNFTLTLNDSIVNIDVSAIGFQSKNHIASSQQNNQISLKENDRSLSEEVIVVGYGASKKKSAMMASTSKNITDSVSPKKGWEHYKTYLQSSIGGEQSLADVADKEIEFEFDIDKKGRAQNVEITKSPSPNINPQLINTIEKGPKWIDQSKQKIARKKARIKL